MENKKKLDHWADKLLDTGKRNNLINLRDAKASSAEIVFPDCENVFSKCTVGRLFEVYDPKIPDDEIDSEDDESKPDTDEEHRITKQEYRDKYIGRIKNDRFVLIYAQTPNPMTAVKNIAKKARQLLDETGINAAYLAFGLIKWNEKEKSEFYYRAPLLLVHVNIITGSVVDPVRIEISDDDIIVNPTFNYFLQANYGLSLPTFEDGDSLASYYEKVAHMTQKMGWEVINECKLGIFSFLKINMYEDLKKNSEQILNSDNIKALLGNIQPDTAYSYGFEHIVENPLIDLHAVIDADSSQIEAIEMAKSGKSFVLQGPPGTGKSQTITNILAECLYDGKKVLFVSEKQAALNVVFDKLKKAGLDDFCLELHSHKANKKAVIEELNRTLEIPKSQVSASVQDEIQQKQEAQQKLDKYAHALHKNRDVINKSLFQLFESYSAERRFPDIQINIQKIQTKGQEYLQQVNDLLDQYVEFIPSIGQNYRDNAWYGFSDKKIQYDDRYQLRIDLDELLSCYKALQSITSQLYTQYKMPELNFDETVLWQSMLAFISASNVITPAIMSRTAYHSVVPQLNQMAKLSNSILSVKERILATFNEQIIDKYNGKDLHTMLTKQYNGHLSHFFSRDYKNLIAGIRHHTKNGNKLKYQQAIALAEQLILLQNAMSSFSEIASTAKGYLGSCYKGVDTDWNKVMSDLQTLNEYLEKEEQELACLSSMSYENFINHQEQFQTYSDALSKEINTVNDAKKRVSQQFDVQILNLGKDSYECCIKKIANCLLEFDKLGNWISFIDLLERIENAELSPYIDLCIEKQVAAEQIPGIYRRLFYKHWIEYIIFSVPELSSFTRIKQDQFVKRFIEKDTLQYEINKSQIKSALSQKRPNLDMIAGGSAVAILRREGQKKKKQMPIRKLLSEIGNLILTIKPCFLMSPLSVSTFLNPERISFDTIIFDEASQIFPQDAIGAIYRGKQLIVVGDSKQMPPSNFFNASTDIDDEDEETADITDYESILDICSAVFNTERLAWHYRSHYEQLIAFSNSNFYNNNLVTFPSASTDHKGIGVDYYYVNGIFDRKNKTNKIEAQFIVDLVYQNIEIYPERSLGIVAFSIAQQNMIDRMLAEKREEDPSYEWFFREDKAEPFFIKNLETVQGDERDTIIFSIAYAKDSQGRFIHNFGPLNRQGGERRLNVAVTRAKDNVQLVSSIHYTDINLNNSGAEGVRLLRAYLDYAQNGEKALERTITVSGKDHFDSDFEQEVCDYLRDNGFTVDTQVGCSGYKIDLGLRKPDSSNYLLAIECDGATYHSSKNARDRDSLRQHVLENMGWTFYRIWSTDWYRNKAVEKERLLHTAKEAIQNSRTIEKASNSVLNTIQADKPKIPIANNFLTEIKDPSYEFPKYEQLNAGEIIIQKSFDFQEGVYQILMKEAPLSEEYLLKRIVYLYGREKVTNVVVSNFNYRMLRCENKGIIRKNGFLYLQDQKDYRLRIPGIKRDIKYIAIEELADGLYSLIKQSVAIPKDSLYKTLTGILGFSRTGEAIVSRYDIALERLKKDNLIVETDGQLSLKV